MTYDEGFEPSITKNQGSTALAPAEAEAKPILLSPRFPATEIAWEKRRAGTALTDTHRKSQAASAACAHSGVGFYLAFPHPCFTNPIPPLLGKIDGGATMLEFEFTVRGGGFAHGKDGVGSGGAVFQT